MHAPRPLKWLSLNMAPKFDSITSLCLCKPSEGNDCSDSEALPHDSDLDYAVLLEWVALLRSVRRSLVNLKFDLRKTRRGSRSHAWVKANPSDALSTPGGNRFCEIIMPLLLQDADWPRLQKIQFYGISLKQKDGSETMDQLHSRFPTVEVQICPGIDLIYNWMNGQVHQDINDDGLL